MLQRSTRSLSHTAPACYSKSLPLNSSLCLLQGACRTRQEQTYCKRSERCSRTLFIKVKSFSQARGHDEQVSHVRQGFVPMLPWRTMRRQTGAFQIYAAVAASAAQAPNTVQISATILGYCVLLGSCTRSVPQILRIIKNKSADGVSMAAQYAELIAYSITLAYNMRHRYAFSTYGDTAACWLQDIVMIFLITRCRKQLGPGTLASGVLIGLGLWAMLSGAVSMKVLAALQASTIAIIALGGRIPQIMLNARRGDSGELSPLTSILNLAGNVARLFTTAVLTKDSINMAATLVQTVLNSVLVWQSVKTAMQASQSEPSDPTALEPKTT